MAQNSKSTSSPTRVKMCPLFVSTAVSGNFNHEITTAQVFQFLVYCKLARNSRKTLEECFIRISIPREVC